MNSIFNVRVARYDIAHPDTYILQGIFEKDEHTDMKFAAYLDGQRLPLKVDFREGLTIRKLYPGKNIIREYYIHIRLPEDFTQAKKLDVFQKQDKEIAKVFQVSAGKLIKQKRMVDSCLDKVRASEDGTITVHGWAAVTEDYELTALDADEKSLPMEMKRNYRSDLAVNYPEGALFSECGFEAVIQAKPRQKVTFFIRSKGRESRYSLGGKEFIRGRDGTPSYIAKGIAYFKRNGVKRTLKRTVEKLMSKSQYSKGNYMRWRKQYKLTDEMRSKQRNTKFEYRPLVSIVVPLYKTPLPYLNAFVDSILRQTYENWELCLSDGSGENSPLEATIKVMMEKDSRIKYIYPGMLMQISENTNQAIEIARGDYIAFADHDDLLAEDALFECVRALNKNQKIDVLYSDEDKVSMDGKEYFQPHFKSDFNIDLLCSMNYICHLFLVKKELMNQVGGLRSEFDGAQDYDFIFRCTEAAGKIHHIPKVLYHWRAHQDSTAENPESKGYAFTAGQRAVKEHYNRMEVKAEVSQGEYPGLYRTRYILPDEGPLVSIIIPNKDHTEDLDKSIRSIMEGSTYGNKEFIIVENNSTQEETFQYYEGIQKEFSQVKVIYWKEHFNYSRINNYGVAHAKGTYLLFLNNDTEMINEDAIEELLGVCTREDVGISGARLYFEDDTIQHGGVIVGFGGIAGHAFIGCERNENGYFSRIICSADLSAVTAACMMVKRSAFEEVGGFDETLAVAFNDIDFCMKVRAAGKLVVYQPYAEFYHYESKSRGYEDTPEKVERFNKESEHFLKKWPDILRKGDPYYNRNLTLDKADFSLKI